MKSPQSDASLFDAYYFRHGCGQPYERNDTWLEFFDGIAETIVRKIGPRAVLDAGCAMGFLVEALRGRGVEAFGVDVSEYAIQHVHPDIKPYCRLGTVTDPFSQKYDLIVCIEVLEHLSPRDAERAVENFCLHTDDVLFSSTPLDYKEATHFNVQPPEYWAELFARHHFFRDVDFDASFITDWAVRFRRMKEPLPHMVREYERKFWLLWKENQDLRSLSLEMRTQLAGKDQEATDSSVLSPDELHPVTSSGPSHTITVVAYAANWENVLSYQRILSPAQDAGVFLIKGNEGDKISPERVSQADIVVIQRDFPRHHREYEEIVARAQAEGKPVVYEMDDLLLELPQDHPDRLNGYYTDALVPMMRAIVEADAVTASTRALCNYLSSLNPNTWLLPNYLNDRLWNLQKPPEDTEHYPIIVGYMGGYTHLSDLEIVSLPLQSILRRYGDQILLKFWGVKPPAHLLNHPNVEWLPLSLSNYAEFAAYFVTQKCDVAIAPLRDDLFNRCKSPLKFLEYGALGVPGVFSKVAPYEGIVVHRENGFLASTAGEWEDYLAELIESPSLRHQIGLRAQETVRKDWLLSQHAHEWKQVYEEILYRGSSSKDQVAVHVARQMQYLHIESQRSQTGKVARLSTDVAEKEQAMQTLQVQAAENEQTLQLLNAQLREWQKRWADLESGIGWRALQKLRSLRLLLAPHNSRREWWLYWILRKKGEEKTDGSSAVVGGLQKSTPFMPSASSAQAENRIQLYLPKSDKDFDSELGTRIQNWLDNFPPNRPAVVVPLFDAYDDVVRCTQSLLTATEKSVPIIVLDDASTDDRISQALERLSGERLAYLRKQSNTGFVNTVNLAFQSCAPRDVVVVNSDVVVPPEWLERLSAAAHSRSNIATATPFTNNGTILSIPYRNRPVSDLIDGMTTEQVDARIRAASHKLRPIIPTAVGHCVYFKRLALDAVGYFDETFSPGYGEEVDFSQRALMAGFIHVLADDLFVFHKGARSFASPIRKVMQESHEQIINQRYPWYRQWVMEVSTDPRNPLGQAFERASAALLGYRTAIDATLVDGTTTGTQVQTLELIRALAASPARFGHLTVIIHDMVPRDVLLGVDQLVDDVIRVSQLGRLEQPSFDLIHRPFQIWSATDLELLKLVAARFIVSQLDFIAFSNPSYAPNPEAWAHYRNLTRATFASADGVAFISNDVASDAAQQGLHLPEERKCVVYTGVNHQMHSAPARPPAASAKFNQGPFILMLGTNFKHKNRTFALEVLRLLIEKYRWSGNLVIAGPSVSWGGSEAEEGFELEHNPGLKSRVHYLGPVSESEKKWLLENAALVLYPSSYEGFGLVPFEAAAAGTPALTTRLTSLIEILGEEVTYLNTLDPESGAETIFSLLSNPEIARRQVEAINVRAASFTWSNVAEKVWNFYRQILEMPPRSRGALSETGNVNGDERMEMKETKGSNANKQRKPWQKLATRGFRIWRSEGVLILIRKAWRYAREWN